MKSKSTVRHKPLISVVMPVYNAAEYLKEALHSIKWQTIKDWEFIIVDDGSTDDSYKILKSYAKKDRRIRLFRFKKNKGLAFALNHGVLKARGIFLARMDADDVSLPNRFKLQLKYLREHPRTVAVGGQAEVIDEKGRVIGFKNFPDDPRRLYEMMMVMMPIQHPILMTYTKIMKKAGYQNHDTAEDVSMFFKLLAYGDFGNVEETIFQYRLRPNSNSLKNPKRTFLLTLKSRFKAVQRWGYEPTRSGVLMTMMQTVIVFLLPSAFMLALYEWLRFKKLPSPLALRPRWLMRK